MYFKSAIIITVTGKTMDLRTIIVMLFLSLSALSAQETEPEEAEPAETETILQKLTRADSFFRNDDKADAIEIYKEYIDSGKAGPGAYFALVRMLLFDNRHLEAIQTAFDGLKRYPKSPHTLTAVGMTCLKSGMITEAQFFFKQALNANKTYAYAYAGASRILNAANSSEDIKFITMALGLISIYPEFELYLAEADSDKGKIKALEDFIESCPGYDLETVRKAKAELALIKDKKPFTLADMKTPFRFYFRMDSGLPVVTVSVNGSEPADFIVGTGKKRLVLDRDWAEQNGIVFPKQNKKNTAVPCAVVDSLVIAGQKAEHIIAEADDLKKIFDPENPSLSDEERKTCTRLSSVRGILPLRQLFGKYAVKIDFHTNEIAVGTSLDDLSLIPDDYSVVPLLAFGPDSTLAAVALKPRSLFTIDTGSIGTYVDQEYMRIHKIPEPEMDPATKRRIIDQTVFQLGEFNFSVKKLPVIESGKVADYHTPLQSGIIGNDILTFISPLILDYSSGRFYFDSTRIQHLKVVKPPTPEPAPQE